MGYMEYHHENCKPDFVISNRNSQNKIMEVYIGSDWVVCVVCPVDR